MKNILKNLLPNIKKWYFVLPDKKRHFELITAVLSIPMILTVIIVNLNTINKNKQTAIEANSTTPIQVIIDNPATNSSNTNPPKTTLKTTSTPTTTPTKVECKKDIGEIEILSPQEGEIINSDNVCINISTDSNYCPVTWSYKLDNSNWSDYNNNDICLYNLTTGKKELQIKVKSTVVDKIITLERNFTYQNSTTPTPTVTPINN
ncbi:MAG: hypothetical protein WC720_04520 [Candidatus Shapirobacteria bacterium]|jgi:hypothetical protein